MSLKEVIEEFDDFDIELQRGQAEEMTQIGELYKVDNIVNEWLAFQSNNHGCSITEATLAKFRQHCDKECDKKRRRLPAAHLAPVHDVITTSPLKQKSTNNNNNDDIINSYLSPEVAKGRYRKVTNVIKQENDVGMEPPAESPFSSKISVNYAKRTNSGEVVNFLCDQGKQAADVKWTKEAASLPQHTATSLMAPAEKKPCYMFQKVIDLSNTLNDAIELIAEDIRSQNHGEIDGYHPCTSPSQNTVTIVGRVSTEQGCKLQGDTICIEGDRTHSSGRTVSVDVSRLSYGSFFRGQVVAFTGVNPTGRTFVASKSFSLKVAPGNVVVSGGGVC